MCSEFVIWSQQWQGLMGAVHRRRWRLLLRCHSVVCGTPSVISSTSFYFIFPITLEWNYTGSFMKNYPPSKSTDKKNIRPRNHGFWCNLQGCVSLVENMKPCKQRSLLIWIKSILLSLWILKLDEFWLIRNIWVFFHETPCTGSLEAP